MRPNVEIQTLARGPKVRDRHAFQACCSSFCIWMHSGAALRPKMCKLQLRKGRPFEQRRSLGTPPRAGQGKEEREGVSTHSLPWARLCRSFRAEYLNQLLTQNTIILFDVTLGALRPLRLFDSRTISLARGWKRLSAT